MLFGFKSIPHDLFQVCTKDNGGTESCVSKWGNNKDLLSTGCSGEFFATLVSFFAALV